jgi:hypothetical protein
VEGKDEEDGNRAKALDVVAERVPTGGQRAVGMHLHVPRSYPRAADPVRVGNRFGSVCRNDRRTSRV